MPTQLEEVAKGAPIYNPLILRRLRRHRIGHTRHRSVADFSGTSGARRHTIDHGRAHGIAGTNSHGTPRISDASGVRTKVAPAGQGDQSYSQTGRGHRRQRSRRRGAAAACERRTVRLEPQAIVRSTRPGAVLPALVRAPQRKFRHQTECGKNRISAHSGAAMAKAAGPSHATSDGGSNFVAPERSVDGEGRVHLVVQPSNGDVSHAEPVPQDPGLFTTRY